MDEEDPRATQLYKFTKAELKDMPANNKNVTKDVAKFYHLAVAARFRNKKKSLLKVFVIILFYFNHLNQ